MCPSVLISACNRQQVLTSTEFIFWKYTITATSPLPSPTLKDAKSVKNILMTLSQIGLHPWSKIVHHGLLGLDLWIFYVFLKYSFLFFLQYREYVSVVTPILSLLDSRPQKWQLASPKRAKSMRKSSMLVQHRTWAISVVMYITYYGWKLFPQYLHFSPLVCQFRVSTISFQKKHNVPMDTQNAVLTILRTTFRATSEFTLLYLQKNFTIFPIHFF